MTKSIEFTKMQGIGNDFILVEDAVIKANNLDYKELAIKMSDRRFGIGADGLIIVNPEDMNTPDADTSWHIFNSDGSEPQMCGNGIRCFAKYVYDKGIVNKKQFSVNTLAGIIIPEIQEDGKVKVNMGSPILEASKIPTSINKSEPLISYPLEIDDEIFNITTVSMGNPHCIIFQNANTKELALEYGSRIEKNKLFPEKTNVEFVQIISKNEIQIDVWERGCGITLACGTGACASTVAAVLNKLTNNSVKAHLPGGTLDIYWENPEQNGNLYMTGDSQFVFEGKFLA